MANVNAPNGLAPVRTLNGGSWNQQGNLYCIPSTDGAQYGVGDIIIAAAGSDANGIPYIGKATSSSIPLGVIIGIDPVLTAGLSLQATQLNLETIAIPATKAHAYYVYVVDDPSVIFEVQGDNTVSLVPANTINYNANPVIANPAAGAPFSGTQLASASITTTSTLMFRILGMAQRPGLDFTANTKLLVMFNTHVAFGNHTAP